ncbi:MAG: extracellular solute-binding protein [Candidatus Kryptoniota bacterium]
MLNSIQRISLVVLVITVWSCGSKTEHTLNNQRVVITYWAAPNQQEMMLASQLVSEWNKNNPDIYVRLQALPANQSTEEVLMAAIAAKTTPDVCSNIWPGTVPEYVRANALVRLSQFSDFDSLVNSRIGWDRMAQFRSADSQYYQIPWKTNPVMMIYNKNIFRAAGIKEPPHTYSDFLYDARKLTFDSNGDGVKDHWMGYRDIRPIWWQRYFDFFTFYCAASHGHPIVSNDEVNADTAAIEKVYDFFQKCFSNQYFPRTTFQYDPFIAGVVATEFVGPWTISYIQQNFPDRINYGIAPVPVPDSAGGPVYTYGDHKSIVIFSTTRHPEKSWRFVKYLLSVKADLNLLEIASQIPVRKDILEESQFKKFFNKNKLMKIFAEQSTYAKEVDQSYDQKEIFDSIAQEFEKCSVYGKETPGDAAKNLLKRIKLIINWDR